MAQDKVENPTKMDDITVKKLEEAFALDATVEEACFYAGISKQTFYNWKRSFPDQAERFDALRNEPILKARKTVVDALGEPDMALKYLERKRKEEFSTRSEQSVKHTGEVNLLQIVQEDGNQSDSEPIEGQSVEVTESIQDQEQAQAAGPDEVQPSPDGVPPETNA